ncbi:MAG: tetratricopeptide repeat protein [Bacteroides sp.]
MAKNQKVEPNGVESIETALTNTEQYLEKNRKWLLLGVGVLVILIVGYIAYSNLYSKPREHEAQVEAYFAEQQFGLDSFAVALNGDGNNFGFLQVLENYSGTKMGNLCNYYAGICYRELGDYDNAIKYLSAYSLQDKMLAPVALGAIGDCYVEKDDWKMGIDYYSKAIAYDENPLTTPIFLFKRGLLYEKDARWADALDDYLQIKEQYPHSAQARDIDKSIERMKLLR